MKDSDDSNEGTRSSDVSSRVSGDEARGLPTTSTSDVHSDSSGVHDAGGRPVSDNDMTEARPRQTKTPEARPRQISW